MFIIIIIQFACDERGRGDVLVSDTYSTTCHASTNETDRRRVNSIVTETDHYADEIAYSMIFFFLMPSLACSFATLAQLVS